MAATRPPAPASTLATRRRYDSDEASTVPRDAIDCRWSGQTARPALLSDRQKTRVAADAPSAIAGLPSMRQNATRTSLSVLVPVYNEQYLVAESLGRLEVLASSPS